MCEQCVWPMCLLLCFEYYQHQIIIIEGQYISINYLETFYLVWIIYVSEVMYFKYSPQRRINSSIAKLI
jgi:hypothetical protein